ncbi:MAG: phosphatase PAP2 family protein [Acidobacteriia bacterium]|nr:phosphatase PAP2 family protein [Terriglobia bacterium]
MPSLRAAIVGSLAVAVLALLLFSWLAEEVFEGGARRFDASVRTWVHQFASPPLTSAMVAISALGSVVLAAAFIVALVIFLRLRWRRAAIWLLLTMAGGLILELTLKFAFHRPRPTPFFGPVPYTYSFPSGHSLMAFCIYGVLAGLLSHRIRSAAFRVLVWILAAALIGAIGLSRIYLGVHYPSDVLAGYLAAAVWVSTLIAADRVRRRKRDSQ